MHDPRSLKRPVSTSYGDVPAWLHGDTPYGELLEAAHAGTLGELLPDEDGELERYAVRALVGLAVPSDYGTRGEDYVSHVPATWLAATRDADTLEESNHAYAVRALEEIDEDREHWFVGRTSHWGVGWIDHPSVVPFVRREDGTWSVTPAWRVVVELGEALESYCVLDEDDHAEREHAELVRYVASEIGDEEDGPWAGYVLERLPSSHVDDVRADMLEELVNERYVELAAERLERYRAWRTLREIGDGQLDIFGGEVRVPAPPSVDELEELTDHELPWRIVATVEGSDEYPAVLEALEELRALALPA